MAQITLRDYLQETEDAISSKRVDEALASCQYILAYFPESLETQRLLGEVYLAQGKLEDAQQSFDWVLTNDPENVVAYCSRALVSERLSDHDTALDCYQQAYELSRGNSQIRQAFNQLSEKAGQPGFMLSRAGLARLYMRGDLLSQAAQEWDVVLAMTPDRLDARTGLLEVYWRLGVYDRAAQLAEQILQDVPGCVKALLLLAYVTAPQDMLRSQELVKKAEVVDPDLVMAHDLFADQMVSRQGDPFLKLLDKSPVALGAGVQPAPAHVSQNADPFASLNGSVGTASPDPLAAWGGNAGWNNDTTLVKPRSDTVLPEETGAAAFPTWMSEGLTSSNKPTLPTESNFDSSTSQWGGEAWNPVSLGQSTPLQEEGAAPVEPWDSLQDALNNISPEVVRQISDPGLPASADVSWLGIDALAAPSSYAESASNSAQNIDENVNTSFAYEGENSWSFAAPVENEPNSSSATPTWLSMLTQGEQQADAPQSSGFSVEPVPLEAVRPEVVQPPISPAPQPFVSQVQPQASPLPQAPVSRAQPLVPPTPQLPVSQVQSPVSQPLPQPSVSQSPITAGEMPEWAREVQSDADEDGEEGIFFGPDWLKTLGATSLDGSEPFDFSVPEEDAPVAREQPVPLEQKPEEVSRSWDLPEVQALSEKSSEPSYAAPAEEPQNTQEEDAWASWQPAASYSASAADQETYQPWTDPSNQPQDDQSFWSLPQQDSPEVSNQEQPSWMSQLSQQSSPEKPASEYTDWMSQSAESWSAGSDVMQIPDESGFQEHQNTSNQTASDDPWATFTEQPAPASSQVEQDLWAMPTEQPAPVSSQEEQDPWAQLSQQVQSQSIDYNWLAQLAGNQQANEPAPVQEAPASNAIPESLSMQQSASRDRERTEQDLVTTLEELESKLLSNGFMPLEPNSLANIAQANQEEYVARPSVEEFSAKVENEKAGPSLSSALAELGNFDRTDAGLIGSSNNESVSQPKPEVRQVQPQPRPQPSEPLWLSSLGAAPVPDPVIPSIAQVPAARKQAEETTVRASALPDSGRVRQPTNPLHAVPYAENELAFAPTNPAPAPAPAIRMNVLLDSELETTMKRPAVRLQPMQQQAAARDHGGNPHSGRGRTGERTGQRLSDSKGNVSYRERLVRGYQAQLIGDFDEAMGEYRLIIRNAPELLGEVVSNVRALLKLAPNYSAGYRVLGDAYMRQGEYLQAMESYNKALTMAKKAKS